MKAKKRYSGWSPTTEALPPPVEFKPRQNRDLAPGMMPVFPMPEAPTSPGVYIVKLNGAYRPSLMAYNGAGAAERMLADHNIGVVFYCRYTGAKHRLDKS